MFTLQNKELLLTAYETIIKRNLKPKEVVYTELQMFLMYNAITQDEVDQLLALYPAEE